MNADLILWVLVWVLAWAVFWVAYGFWGSVVDNMRRERRERLERLKREADKLTGKPGVKEVRIWTRGM